MRYTMIFLAILLALSLSSCGPELMFDEVGNLVPLTVMEDNSLPSVDVNGVKLHAESFGDPTDPMLVVLHGGPGADYRGQLNFKQLADDSLFVVFYDQRGSGLSQRLEEDSYTNVQVFIDELEGVIKHYRNSDTQKVILAGHSWGAMLATAYINQKPTEIDGLILAEPGGFTWEQTEAYISRSRQLKLFDETTNDFVYQDQFITGSDHNTLDYKFALSTAGDVSTGDISPAPYWRYGAICNTASINLVIEDPEQLNFTSNLEAYNTDVLFVYSELNDAYGLAHAELLSSSLPNVELIKINGCGHEIPHHGWGNYYPIVQDYLNKIL